MKLSPFSVFLPSLFLKHVVPATTWLHENMGLADLSQNHIFHLLFLSGINVSHVLPRGVLPSQHGKSLTGEALKAFPTGPAQVVSISLSSPWLTWSSLPRLPAFPFSGNSTECGGLLSFAHSLCFGLTGLLNGSSNLSSCCSLLPGIFM